MNAARQEKSLARRLALPALGGAIAGFVATFLFLNLTDADAGAGPGLGISREIAGIVGISYILGAIGGCIGIVNPRLGARFMNVEDADELREQRRMFGYAFTAMMALGAALFLLAFVEPAGSIGGRAGAAAALGLVLVACILGHLQTRHVDELQRLLSRESIATAFYLLFAIGGGWALLAHCGLTAAPAPLDWLTMFAATLLAGCLWQAGRRGLLTRGPN